MDELVRRVGRLQRLAVFEAAARYESFTAAAEELGMTQPGVTKQVSTLEDVIGVELFDRRPNRVVLTQSGRDLLEAVQGGFGTIERTLRQIQPDPSTFVLAANPGIAQRWLVPLLDSLQKVIDDADLRLWLFDRDSELGQGQFDAAIHIGTGDWGRLQSRRLFPEIAVPVASPDLASDYGFDHETPPVELRKAELLHLDSHDRSWMGWSDWFTAHGVDLPPASGRVTYNNYALVMEEAISGRGVALAWGYLVDDLLEQGLLVAVGPPFRHPKSGYYLIWPTSAPSDSVQKLADWLDSLINEEQRTAGRSQ